MTGTPASERRSDAASLPAVGATSAALVTEAATEIVVPGLPVSEVRTASLLTVAEKEAKAARSVAARATVAAAAASARRCGRRRRTITGALRTGPGHLPFGPGGHDGRPDRATS